MALQDSPKLITCILPKGKALPVLEALRAEQGIISANINNARGTGRITLRAFRTGYSETEKEVLRVVVPEERADELFEFIFDRAEIDRPHGGIMYQTALDIASTFELPDLPEED